MKKRKTGQLIGCVILAVLMVFSCLAGCGQPSAGEAQTIAVTQTKTTEPSVQPPQTEAVQSAESSTMHLEKIQGTVEIEDAQKTAVPAREGMQLYSGYALETAKESLAWLSLDKTKAMKLDVLSSAQVRQQGKKLEISLLSGGLFFDVSSPLAQDESLDIRTATMIMGIRGTCGWVYLLDERTLQVALLEGTVDVESTDPETGESQTVTVEDGQILTIARSEEAGETAGEVTLHLESLKEERVPVFAGKEVAGSPELQNRIAEKSPLSVEKILTVASDEEEEPPAAQPQPAPQPYIPPEPVEEFAPPPPAANETPAKPENNGGSGGSGEPGDSGDPGGTGGDGWVEPPSELEKYGREWWEWMIEYNWDIVVEYKDNWSEERPENLPEDVAWPPQPIPKPDPSEPDPSEPDPSEPDPSEPDPSEPGPSEPDPSEPDPSEPDPSEPDPSEPDPSEPDPSEPDPSEPDPSEPDPSEPDPSEPDPSEPDPSEPDPSEPDPSEPDPSEPDPSEPDPSEPDPSGPDPEQT